MAALFQTQNRAKARALIALIVFAASCLCQSSADELRGSCKVFVGGAQGTGFEILKDRTQVHDLLERKNVGLYLHGGGVSEASKQGVLKDILATWSAGCRKTSEHGYIKGSRDELNLYFTRVHNIFIEDGIVTNINVNSGNFEGGFDERDLQQYKLWVDVARDFGFVVVAPIVTPNGGREPIDSWTSNNFWKNARAAAIYGKGIALDASGHYAMAVRDESYRKFIVEQIKWAHANSLRANLILQAGHPGASKYTVLWLNYLANAGALPDEYDVENYTPAAYPLNSRDDPDSVISVARWVSSALASGKLR